MSEHETTPEVVPAGTPTIDVVNVRSGMFGANDGGDTSGFGGLVRAVAVASAASRPYGSWYDDAADALEQAYPKFSEAIEKVVVEYGELTLHIRREYLLEVAQALRDDAALRFEMCMGVSGVHWPGDSGRELHAVYPLVSITHNRRLKLEVGCPDTDPHIPSLYSVYPSNDWHERETYDFFGIIFDGHPSLSRIQMPDDWSGHPQRKDYPLGGIPVEYKGAEIAPPDERRQYS
ncbi:MAG: NADH-quinone oxidoreductase subunit C [Actinomycetia bacterium]|nr:NADH-quinone oxidoreductase subunit C [Actinomycetes bacterium]